MKIRQLIVCLVGGGLSASAFAMNPVMGVSPEKLLAVLPPPPPEWKLKTSLGTNEISAYPALLSFATREYFYDPPPLEDGTKPPQKRCRLVLLDSAFDPDRSLIYDDFAMPKGPDKKARKRYQVDGASVIEQWKSPVACNLRVAFADRFHLTMFLENLDEKEAKQWLAWVQPANILTAARNAPKLPPTPDYFEFHYVNELDPTKNRVSQIGYMTQEQQRAELGRAEQFSKGMEKIQAAHDKASAAAGVPPPKD